MKKISLFLTLIVITLILALPIKAVNMDSDNYRIQWGNINIGGRDQSSTNYNLGVTMGQISPGFYSSSGYKVRAGFQYVHTIIPFVFTISDITIDFGNLIPQSPATDTNTLTISAGGAGGYQILAFESHPLETRLGDEIVDTTCDNSSCDETSAEVWSQNTTYGFGFNINGDDTPADFTDTTYFRQFADDESNETHQAVMSNNKVTSQSQATVTYKVNISGQQETGKYETGIVYIAVPSY